MTDERIPYGAADTSIVIEYLGLLAKDEDRAVAWLRDVLGDLRAIPATVLQELAVSRDAPTIVPRVLEDFDVLAFDAAAALMATDFQRIAQPPKLTKAAKGKWFRDAAIVGTCARHGVRVLATVESAWTIYQRAFVQLSAGGELVVVGPPVAG